MSNDDYLAWLMQTREHLHSAISLAPNNPDYEDADAAICYKLAYFDSKKSEEWLQLAIRKSFELGSKHPDRPHYFKHAIFGHNAIAQNAVKAGQWAEACEHCERAMKLIDNHFRTSQNNADIHSAILATLEFHARALEHLDIPKAIAVYEQFITAAEKFEKLEKKYEFYRMLRADAHLSQAKLHHQLGDSATCQQFFAEALTVLEGYVPDIDSHAGMLADLQSRIAEFGAMLHGTH
jgi:tetratricopeptide (TPR) repeat protein